MMALKRCPMCGHEAILRIGINHHYVRCDNPSCLLSTRRYSIVEDAVNAWNTRYKGGR